MLKDSLYSHRTPGGLDVYVYEMPDKSSVSAQLSVGFGSSMIHVTDKKKVLKRLPAGTAHFLEHKLFEQNGEDAFSVFAQLGSSSNAYTTFNRTTFVFRSGEEYEVPLRKLLEFTGAPKFTEDGVEKEKPIILDEIRMYLDDPGWRSSFNLFRSLYRNIGINEDIAGNQTSVLEIDRDLLSDCFDSFYRPENMALAVAGNVHHERVFEIADSFYNKNALEPRFTLLSASEPAAINTEYFSENMTVSVPLFDIGFKEPEYRSFSDIRNEMLMDMVLDMIAGESTEFFRKMYDMNLFNDSFGSGFYSGDEYLCTFFEGDASEPERVRDLLLERIKELKHTGLDAALFDERVRTAVGSYIGLFDSPGSVAGSLISCHFKNTDLYDIIQHVGEPHLDEAEQLLRSCFDPELCALSVIMPIQTGER